MSKQVTGIVDVGGGMRAAYGAGVFDCCLTKNIDFDYFAGVSAGAANIVSFLAGQRGRNYKFYTEYAFRKQYMSLSMFLRTGNYLSLEYIYGDGLTNSCGEYPLDYKAMKAKNKDVVIVATDAKTGEPVYFPLDSMKQDDYGAIKGSSCVPVASKPYAWKGMLLYDGGISDPIPFQKAFDYGCERVIIILTRPKDSFRDAKKDQFPSKLIQKKYPQAAKALRNRADAYNRELKEALELEKEGKVLIVAPDTIEGMKTLTKDRGKIIEMYQKGVQDGTRIEEFLTKNI